MNQKFLLLFSILNFFNSAYSCSVYHEASINDTCKSICLKYNLSLNELMQLNHNNLNCECLDGFSVCVSSAKFKRSLVLNCTKTVTVQAEESCFLIRIKNGLSEQQFNYFNPNLDCNLNNNVCVDDGQIGCIQYYEPIINDTCDSIANAFDLDQKSMIVNNPDLNCDNITSTGNICVLKRNPNCSKIYYFNDEDTIDGILLKFNLTETFLYMFNPSLRISSVTTTQAICLNATFSYSNRANNDNNTNRKKAQSKLIIILVIVILVLLLVVVYLFLR